MEKVPEKVWEALVQSQVRFNRVPEKVPDKVPGSLGAKPSQVLNGFWRRLQRRPRGRFWESLVQGRVRFNRFNKVSSAWLCSMLQKDF